MPCRLVIVHMRDMLTQLSALPNAPCNLSESSHEMNIQCSVFLAFKLFLKNGGSLYPVLTLFQQHFLHTIFYDYSSDKKKPSK